MFDDIYATMLRLLGWLFGAGDPRRAWTRLAAKAAIAAMPVVLEPVGGVASDVALWFFGSKCWSSVLAHAPCAVARERKSCPTTCTGTIR
jgi:hypothetical protein